MVSRFPIFAITAVAVGLLAFPSCKRKLTDRNFACVKMDMSQKEVETILGSPTRVETIQIPHNTDEPLVRYFYEQNGKTVELHFFDGKLISQEVISSK